MKKIGVMLIALAVLGFVLTGCGLLNPVKNTSWTYSNVEEESYYGVTYTQELTYTLSFADDTVTLDVNLTVSAGGYSDSESITYTGTYEYADEKVTGTLTNAGETQNFTATVEKDTLIFSQQVNGATVSIEFTKVKK